MICKKCGTEIPEDSVLCPDCGEAVDKSKPVETEVPTEDTKPATDPFSVEETIDDIKTASAEISKKIVEEGEKHVIPDIKSKESVFSFAGMIRKFAIYSIIAFFLPTMTVSCYGYTYKISNWDAMVGVVEGESLGETNPIVILFLLIPIAILSLHVFKKVRSMAGKNLPLLTFVLAIAEFVMWVIYMGKIANYGDYAEYITVGTTLWFWLEMIAVVSTILLSGLVMMKKADFETPIFQIGKIVGSLKSKPKTKE